MPAPVIFAGMSVDAQLLAPTSFPSFYVSPEGRREKSAPSALLSNTPQYHIRSWLPVMHIVVSFSEEGEEGKGLRGDGDVGAAALAPTAASPCQMSCYHVALQCHAVMALAGPHEWVVALQGAPGADRGSAREGFRRPRRPARRSGPGGARRCGRDGGGGAGPGKCGGHVAGVTWRGSRAQPPPPPLLR